MGNFICTDHIKYKIQKRGRIVAKNEFFDARDEGKILICKDLSDKVRIVCEILTDFEHPKEEIMDIRNITLPLADEDCTYYCFIPSNTDIAKVNRIKHVLNGIDKRDASLYNTKSFRRLAYLIDNDNEYYFVTNVDKGKERTVCRSFGVDPFQPERSNKIHLEQILKEITGSPPDDLISQLKDWLQKTPFTAFYKDISRKVQGQAELSLVAYFIYHYCENIAKGLPVDRQSIILAGPSGCGKTETYRAVKELFKNAIPKLAVDLVDINQITSEGFNGKNTKHLVQGLINSGSKGYGIVFLDEFDKRLIPMHTSSGDNVNREIQGQLLLAIEGCMLEGVDTSKTLFIGMGSFNEIRERRSQVKHIGFDIDRTEKVQEHYEPITKADMIELGASFELLGRFGQIINYGPLPFAAIDNVIDMRLSEITDSFGIKVSVNDSMRHYLHENSNTEYGNRLIDSIIHDAATRAIVEALTNGIEPEEIVVTGEKEYIIKAAGRSA